LECLKSYAFPGNIRELQNLLERARILATGNKLKRKHFPGICTAADNNSNTDSHSKPKPPNDSTGTGFNIDNIQPLNEVEQQYLHYVLKTFSGKRVDLAQKLGVSLRTLTRKIGYLSKAGE
jgi:DNA-binding NtrC family response regulator